MKRKHAIDASTVSIHDSMSPSLKGGDYTIHVNQEVMWDGRMEDGHEEPKIMEAVQKFTVDAPRFVLDPKHLGAQHPLQEGQFEDTIPHLILTNQSLPWSRWIEGDAELPWMALLLLREDEWVGNGKPVTMTVADCFHAHPTTVEVPCNIPPEATRGNLSKCRSIDIPTDILRKVLLKENEAAWLANVRASVPYPEQSASIILSNRIPKVKDGLQQRFHVYFVSLEGHEERLKGTFPDKPLVRFIVLDDWSFTCSPSGEKSFRAIVKNLWQDMRSNGPWLRHKSPEISNPPAVVEQRISDGFSPLSYHTISGESTMAWIRGAGMPVAEAKPRNVPNIWNAFQLLQYDQKYGVFDASWAVAYQFGKAAALANRKFAEQLCILRRQYAARFMNEKLASYSLAANPDDIWTKLEQALGSPWANRVHEAMSENTEFPIKYNRKWRKVRKQKKKDPFGQIREVISDPFRLASHFLPSIGTQEEIEVVQFLDLLQDMNQISFPYLVPQIQMLAAEQMRLFRLDSSWMESMVDGALSIGVHSDWDQAMNAGIRRLLKDHDDGRIGLIIRSSLLSDYPGVRIQGVVNGAAVNHKKVEIQDQIAVYLFDEEPTSITIAEHHEKQRFGYDVLPDKSFSIDLRSTENFSANLGCELGDNYIFHDTDSDLDPDSDWRNKELGVLNIEQLQRHLHSQIGRANEWWGSSTFALQLLDAPDYAQLTMQ
ncbi:MULTISPECIES: hypothetical protein [unclassified Paenibacillus]|uniref:hypothetical protein n=1 Tax=unclassified Paenibacillus TaxID=185978 RepID=UPI0027830F17|nr:MULTISPECIES: hypothetical protein [unclassified Paenibacillus]MDQ0896367.1 hypothetical protein [Paenibacillus sp. V4I7]MDQ0914089.1 hypothetical protein [Paenibacillus sp. V4I5]